MSYAPPPSPRTWKLTLAYDGTDFRGWQVQPGEPTIQGELQSALGRITGESPLPQGSGRTDAGVHALAQVASFSLTAPIPVENLHRALNRTLPPSIRVTEARAVQSTFHARHSARAKTYEYRIFRGPICPPFLARYVHECRWPLDLDTLQQSAALFTGEHDFTSFAATDPDASTRKLTTADEPDAHSHPAQQEVEGSPRRMLSKMAQPTAQNQPAKQAAEGSPRRKPGDESDEETESLAGAKEQLAAAPCAIRSIFSSTWETRQTDSSELLVYRVRGNGFLHHMVRNLVGTMLDAARGQIQIHEIAEILAARSRSAAGPTAPARGLFLHSVEYNPIDDAPIEHEAPASARLLP